MSVGARSAHVDSNTPPLLQARPHGVGYILIALNAPSSTLPLETNPYRTGQTAKTHRFTCAHPSPGT